VARLSSVWRNSDRGHEFRCVSFCEQPTFRGCSASAENAGQVLNGKRVSGTASDWEMQMMSDARRLVRPGAAASRSAATTAIDQYCQVGREDYDASEMPQGLSNKGSPLSRLTLERPEP
jgi:hypothetical protein